MQCRRKPLYQYSVKSVILRYNTFNSYFLLRHIDTTMPLQWQGTQTFQFLKTISIYMLIDCKFKFPFWASFFFLLFLVTYNEGMKIVSINFVFINHGSFAFAVGSTHSVSERKVYTKLLYYTAVKFHCIRDVFSHPTLTCCINLCTYI